MPNWVWILAVGGIIALGGFLIDRFGDARYDAGVADERAMHSTSNANANETARQNRERIAEDEAKIPDSDLLDTVRQLGILRPQSAR